LPSFDLAEGSYRYRPLRLEDPKLVGYDVFALQTGLLLEQRDGIFGERTQTAVLEFQRHHKLVTDGVAGPTTQRVICQKFLGPLRRDYGLPKGLPTGQVAKESGYLLGNHTPPYNDGSRDCGVAQRNTRYTSIEEAFNVPLSLTELVMQTSFAYVAYRDIGIVSERRAWELAAGHHNRPAYTDALARGKTTVTVDGHTVDLSAGTPARIWIEDYIQRVCSRVRW
jgi:peptidoglycan hydrolase-like protein with peptidoglycan-binding domain